MLPVRTVSYLEPLSVTSLACLMGVCLLWAYLYRFALLGATSTVHNGWLRWLDPSCRVTCRLRFLPWFLGSWRHRFYTIWRMSAGTCLGYRVVDTRHPVGAYACLGLGSCSGSCRLFASRVPVRPFHRKPASLRPWASFSPLCPRGRLSRPQTIIEAPSPSGSRPVGNLALHYPCP